MKSIVVQFNFIKEGVPVTCCTSENRDAVKYMETLISELHVCQFTVYKQF